MIPWFFSAQLFSPCAWVPVRRDAFHRVLVLAVLLLPMGVVSLAAGQDSARDSVRDRERPAPVVVDDFETYRPGTFPDDWTFVRQSGETLTYEESNEPGEDIVVRSEDGNQFVRVTVRNEAIRYTQRNGKEIDWSIEKRPRLKWRWRAHHLPEGASERGKNDTGAAIYVTFGTDWLGRPKSIKYTYSSSLPVGSVVSFGPLKVIVVDSKREPRMGEWKTIQRNVVDDYNQVFGGTPPDRPLSITFWSDSDTTGDYAKVDFDDIELLPPYRRSR
mgnify:CR=1 FL=1